ncbi:hypothetical protein B0H16DRAFT_1685507 [Mycena metata]|uniref:F-box domain-containing protein n=1 Tax=Mycena metata TaxID=1033252 RepID=A0AAD7JVY3_9AGAR|nr:hypothetical protein B0H16DRAFT_1685507 [Mycena metata]
MTIHFLDFPSEILIAILLHLDLLTLTSCLATNRRVKSIIDSSTPLQYRLATQAACVEDNPYNTDIGFPDKLAALQRRQATLNALVPTSIYTIEMHNFPHFDSYALSSGIFSVGEFNSSVLKWFSITTREPVFQQLEVDGCIQDWVLAIPGEDLLAMVVTSKPLHRRADDHLVGPVELRLYEMSSGSLHPRAREPVIEVDIDDEDISTFELEVCGPKIILLVTYIGTTMSLLLVYDWKEGRLLMDISGGHSAATFLSPDILLLVQALTGTFELWTIEENVRKGPDGALISLKLPLLAKPGRYTVTDVDSNTKGQASLLSHEPFHSSFADSVALFQVSINCNDPRDTNLNAFMFLVLSRRELLRLIPSAEEHGTERSWRDWGPSVTRWLEKDEIVNKWQTITSGQRCAIGEPDSGRVRVLDFNPYTYRKLAGTHQSRDAIVHVVSGDENQMIHLAVRPGIFGEEVSSQLGCVVVDSPEERRYNGILLDEKWIVGIKDTLDLDDELVFDVWSLE